VIAYSTLYNAYMLSRAKNSIPQFAVSASESSGLDDAFASVIYYAIHCCW